MYDLFTDIRCWFHKQKILLFENDPYMEGIVLQSRMYAYKISALRRHKYDGKHYEFHTYKVYEYVKKYIHLIPESERKNVLSAAFTHDTIEDCAETFNDVKKATNERIAELTSALTTLVHGKTRKERAPNSYYRRIKKTDLADFLKICDRLANVSIGVAKKSSMSKAYKDEYEKFKTKLYSEIYKPMFDELDTLLFNN